MKYLFILLSFMLLFSCQNTKKNNEQNIDKTKMHVVSKHQINTYLEKNNEKNVLDWKEYVIFSNKIEKFQSISAEEALNNALQLSKLVKLMKDSIRPKELITNSFRTRVNVLENEVLRLKDMTYISSITSQEVNNQVIKILEAFSATNSKINIVYSQLEVEKEILNNTKHTVLKKTINPNKLNQFKVN